VPHNAVKTFAIQQESAMGKSYQGKMGELLVTCRLHRSLQAWRACLSELTGHETVALVRMPKLNTRLTADR